MAGTGGKAPTDAPPVLAYGKGPRRGNRWARRVMLLASVLLLIALLAGVLLGPTINWCERTLAERRILYGSSSVSRPVMTGISHLGVANREFQFVGS